MASRAVSSGMPVYRRCQLSNPAGAAAACAPILRLERRSLHTCFRQAVPTTTQCHGRWMMRLSSSISPSSSSGCWESGGVGGARLLRRPFSFGVRCRRQGEKDEAKKYVSLPACLPVCLPACQSALASVSRSHKGTASSTVFSLCRPARLLLAASCPLPSKMARDEDTALTRYTDRGYRNRDQNNHPHHHPHPHHHYHH